MKKIIIYILAAIISSLIISTLAASISIVHAATPTEFIAEPTTENLIAARADIIPIIPKPSSLPGPSHTVQEEAASNPGGLNTARKLLGESILPKIAVTMAGFAGMTAMLFLVIGGVRFATAYGNDEAIEKAKNQIIYSLIGLIIAILAYAIVTIIINFKFEGDTTIDSTSYQEFEIQKIA